MVLRVVEVFGSVEAVAAAVLLCSWFCCGSARSETEAGGEVMREESGWLWVGGLCQLCVSRGLRSAFWRTRDQRRRRTRSAGGLEEREGTFLRMRVTAWRTKYHRDLRACGAERLEECGAALCHEEGRALKQVVPRLGIPKTRVDATLCSVFPHLITDPSNDRTTFVFTFFFSS